ncbi:MAG: hypothetical protein ACK417_04405 [Bacteroidia bacterium]
MQNFELTANEEMLSWLRLLRKPQANEELCFHGFFPVEDVLACLDVNLDPLPFRNKVACPLCARPSHQLRWIRYSSPADAWSRGGGVLGSLSLCDKCGIQVQFIQQEG